MGAVEFFSVVLPAAFWPIVVLLVVWWQRAPISRLIDRVKSGKMFGQEFDTTPPAELEDAAEGGASSPEVEKVLAEAQSSMDAQAQPPTEVLQGDPEVRYFRGRMVALEQERQELLARLGAAREVDEKHRRDEIERVIRMAARWGAEVAAAYDLSPGGLDPVIEWQANGEPRIYSKARRGGGRSANEQRHLTTLVGRAAVERELAQLQLDNALLHDPTGKSADVASARQRLDQFEAQLADIRAKSNAVRHGPLANSSGPPEE